MSIITTMEKTVIIGSRNPVKVQCVKNAFEKSFPREVFSFEGVDAASNVSDQPMTDEETYRGAFNRATNAKTGRPDAQYWVGIEGGISDADGLMEAFAWIVILSSERTSRARTATFLLPDKVAQLVRQGIELGVADDQVFGRSNSKQKDGAVGLLTHGQIDRTQYYTHAMTLALAPFINKELFH
ncbi:MAG: inosine/xanthosine triphosphatase [Imperialibacter sp.]|uniref:inosine/xanthosine triphosphatase n=1 Tax=Imperialibacter sp. TaxID=2038411 RepID=UPI0032EF56E5